MKPQLLHSTVPIPPAYVHVTLAKCSD